MNYFINYVERLKKALTEIVVTNPTGMQISVDVGFNQLCELSCSLNKSKNTKYFVGNGASAAFADHMALDWTKNGGIISHSFSNVALLTAVGNDLSFEEVFAAPLNWYAKNGDILVAISSSGNSPDILSSINLAKEKNLFVITLTGLEPNNLARQRGDLNFYVPAKTYGIVECVHQIVLHIWLDKYMGVEDWSRDNFQNMSKDSFNL